MVKRKNGWARMDVLLPRHPKIATLDVEARWLYVASILQAKHDRTDGFVRAPVVCVAEDIDMDFAEVLVARGLWHRAGHDCPDCPEPEAGRGWVVIHDFLEWQESQDAIQTRSDALSAAGRRGAGKRWATADPKAKAKATAKADPMAKAKANPTGNPTKMARAMANPNGHAIADTDTDQELAKSVGPSSSASSQSLTTNELAKITALTGGGPKHAEQTAAFILSKAPADLRDPLAYVLAAVRNEPDSYRYRRGNPKTADDMCPEHPGEWRDACRACAIDRRLEEVGDDWEPDWTEDL